MMRITFFLLLFFIVAGTQAQLNVVNKKGGYSYWTYTPTKIEEPKEPLPVIVFLHGRSLSGTDLKKVKRYGVLRAIERGRELQAIVAAPQTSNGWNPDHVIELIDEVIKEHNGDPSRVYVCGMSMGGYGTLDVAGKYPDRIAAAVAICGGGTAKYACNLSQVPLWIQHGNKDFVVPLSESKKIYNAIVKCNPKANATLTVIKGGTHGSVERLFHQDEIYDWMFKHQLNKL